MPEPREVDYIVWQNRSLRFYLGARLCFLNDLYAPAAFCAQQALETILKATLKYWDRSFDPKTASHKMKGMLRTLRNKVPSATGCEVPTYFHFEGRYQTTSRYPTGDRGLGIPASFLHDLDLAFFELIRLVPFQFNSELIHLLAAPDSVSRRVLTRRNDQTQKLVRFLGVKRRQKGGAVNQGDPHEQ